MLLPEDDQATTGGASFGWTQQLVGGSVDHEVTFLDAATGLTEINQLLITRVLCHAIVDRMPDGHVAETFDTLKNIFEWSQLDVPAAAGLLVSGSAPMPAQLLPQRDRDEFYAEED